DVAHESKGYIIPAHQILVSPEEVSGKITALFFIEGQHVKQGEPLAQIKTTMFEKDVRRAKGVLDNAKNRLEELRRSLPLQIEQARARLISLEAQREFRLRDAESTCKAGSGATDMQRTLSKSDLLK